MARSKPIKQSWTRGPELTPQQVLFRLYSQPSFLAESAKGELSQAEQRLLTWVRPYRSWKSALADLDAGPREETLTQATQLRASLDHR